MYLCYGKQSVPTSPVAMVGAVIPASPPACMVAEVVCSSGHWPIFRRLVSDEIDEEIKTFFRQAQLSTLAKMFDRDGPNKKIVFFSFLLCTILSSILYGKFLSLNQYAYSFLEVLNRLVYLKMVMILQPIHMMWWCCNSSIFILRPPPPLIVYPSSLFPFPSCLPLKTVWHDVSLNWFV